jgi:hypothetical protein
VAVCRLEVPTGESFALSLVETALLRCDQLRVISVKKSIYNALESLMLPHESAPAPDGLHDLPTGLVRHCADGEYLIVYVYVYVYILIISIFALEMENESQADSTSNLIRTLEVECADDLSKLAGEARYIAASRGLPRPIHLHFGFDLRSFGQ